MIKKILILYSVLVSVSIFANQINTNRSWSSFSFYGQMVQEGLQKDHFFGKKYKGILTLQYDHVTAPLISINTFSQERELEIVENFQRLRIGAGYLIKENFFAGLSIPYDRVISRNYIPGGDNSSLNFAPVNQAKYLLGDITLVGKYLLSHKKNEWNWTLIPMLSLPTGNEAYFNTDAGLSYGLSLGFVKYLGQKRKWRLFGNAGFIYSPNSIFNPGGNFSVVDTSSRLKGGLGINFSFSKPLSFFSEFRGFTTTNFDPGQNPIELSFGTRYQTSEKLSLFAATGIEGVFSEKASNDNRFVLGIKYLYQFSKCGSKACQRLLKASKIKRLNRENRLPAPIPKKRDIREVIMEEINNFANIYFEVNSALLKEDSKKIVKEIANVLKENVDNFNHTIVIVGHTDSRLDDDFNQNLSIRRAISVFNALVNEGVPVKKLRYDGKGESRPVDQRESEEAWKKNRRVEFIVK